MADKNTAAFGIYSDRTAVETAVDTLKAEGYRNTDISVLFPQTTGTAGPIMAALAGAGVGGTVGGVVGALVGMGIPEYEAKRYEGRIKKGGILLSVHCDNSEWTKKAKKILEDTGAEDVSSTGEASADFSKTDRPMLRPDAPVGKPSKVVPLADEDEIIRPVDPTLPRNKKIS